MKRNIMVIACGVLEKELQARAADLNINISSEYLEAGLHDQPDKLKRELQQAIDRASEHCLGTDGEFDAIVVGYGLCGRGTVGIKARNIPLVIPRVHDCISLFLGSAEKYHKQFKKNPGTFYMTGGWYEHKTQPMALKKKKSGQVKGNWDISAGFEAMRDKYGRDNAEEIYNFFNSWKRNYSRTVYIDTGVVDGGPYESYSEDLASELGWEYEKVIGSPDLFTAMLTGKETNEQVLVVPPYNLTAYDPLKNGLHAVDPEIENKSVWDRLLPDSASATGFSTASEGRKSGLGLGIDAGGTYTDAVIYDFSSQTVLARAKAPTTKWNFTLGITDALKQLPQDRLAEVEITVVSTTLATNAIVEGRSRKTGLLLMPIGKSIGKVEHNPCKIVGGRLSINGEELTPIDEEEIRCAARELVDNNVEAFAVSGYGSTVNPLHELQIKKIIEEETGLGVCCGHELSDTLNFFVRANTAVLNAGIIPLLEQFIHELETALGNLDVDGTLMIVRGDGSLMSRDKAVSHPVETTLSGPAASISGARFLTGCEDAVIIDVGGTTSDIGLVTNGKIRLESEGARVGKWHTHIKAVDMTTLGAGGDSRILIENHEITAGPQRAVPFARLTGYEGWEEAVGYIEQLHTDYFNSTAALEVVALTGRKPAGRLTQGEAQILALLDERPYSLKELSAKLTSGLWTILELSRLENSAVIMRFSLTPTDLFTASGKLELWPAELPRRILKLYTTIWGAGAEEFADEVLGIISDNLLKTLVLQELDVSADDTERITGSPAFKALISNIKGGSRALKFTPTLNTKLIGVGAAAGWLLRKPAEILGAQLLLPENGDVANAVGAVCSTVSVSRKASVNPSAAGGFQVVGLDAPAEFDDFNKACDYLETQIPELIRADAEAAGTQERVIIWNAENRTSSLSDGNSIFLGRDYTVSITGLPV